jgi:hypothetical protein
VTPYGQQFNFSGVNLLNDPAYQFDLQQGENAIQGSAAASGGLVRGASMAALNNYAQGNALNSYQTAYNNALTNYNTAYNVWANNQQNTFNRQLSMASLGENAATSSGYQANQSANNVAQINSTAAANQGNYVRGCRVQPWGRHHNAQLVSV